MAKDLTKLGPKGLATELEKRRAVRTKAGDAVRALAANGLERWSDTVARLGADHKLVAAYDVAARAEEEVEQECANRYGAPGSPHGAVSHAAHWPTFLRVRATR